MYAIAAGWGPHSALNDAFHRVMLVVLLAGLALLSPGVRETLRGSRAV